MFKVRIFVLVNSYTNSIMVRLFILNYIMAQIYIKLKISYNIICVITFKLKVITPLVKQKNNS